MSFTQIDSIYQQVWTSNIQFWSFPIFLGTFMSRGIFWKLEPLNSQIGSFLAVHCCWSSHFDWSPQSFEILCEKQSVNMFLKLLMLIIRSSKNSITSIHSANLTIWFSLKFIASIMIWTWLATSSWTWRGWKWLKMIVMIMLKPRFKNDFQSKI